MATSVRVEMGIYDLTAKADLSARCEGLQPFAGLDCFTAEEPLQPAKYATLEPGRFVLDGSMVPFPDDMGSVEWGLWGGEMSHPDTGSLAEPVDLWFDFSEPHESIGLTFYFEPDTGERAGLMLVRWFGPDGLELARYRARPTSTAWFLQKRVSGFTRVCATFYGTATPGRYLKLTGVEFGTRRIFSGSEVLAASLLEQVDPSGSQLPVSELALEVLSADAEFSILNPEGSYYGLRHNQPMQVTGYIDGGAVPFGTYYLASWECEGEHTARFTAVDVVGLLDNAPFEGGVYDTTAAVLCAELLAGYEYQLADELRAEPVKGWLAAGTRREALQQLAFALGAVADTSRDGVVKLYRVAERPSAYISYDRKLRGASSVSQRQYISAVDITAHSYAPGGAREEVFRGELAAGTHTLRFEAPLADITLTGARLERAGANHAVVTVTTGGEVVATARPYLHSAALHSLDNRILASGEDENVLAVAAATLVWPGIAPAVAARLVGYHARRYRQQLRMRVGAERLGDTVIVGSFGREKVKGIIESMEIDLAGGLLADVVLYGERMDSRWMYYAGELAAGRGGVV